MKKRGRLGDSKTSVEGKYQINPQKLENVYGKLL